MDQTEDMSREYIIYGSDQCPMCDIAKELLDEEEKTYTYVNARDKYGDEWRQIFTDLKSLVPDGWKTIPMIFRKGEFIGGAKELDIYLATNVEVLDEF